MQILPDADNHFIATAWEHSIGRLIGGPRPFAESPKRMPLLALKVRSSELRSRMMDKTTLTRDKTLLVFNCHEPWVYQLGVLGYRLDVIVNLRGKYNLGWDERMRPLPANARLVTLPEALESRTRYYCMVAHNVTDLIDMRSRSEPKILVLHHTLEGRVEEERPGCDPHEFKDRLHKYVEMVGAHVVATSMYKGESWGFTEDIVHFGIDVNDYLPYSGEKACGVRICNFVNSRRRILRWDLHEKAFGGIPVTLVGHNPDIPGVQAARDWNDLKRTLQSHRFYIHTADPRLEGGYNMASAEAMAAGLPVLGNHHPTSAIRHGISGFLSDDPSELQRYARMLLEDRDLAALMGQQARRTIAERFSLTRFRTSFTRSIEIARRKWRAREAASGAIPVDSWPPVVVAR